MVAILKRYIRKFIIKLSTKYINPDSHESFNEKELLGLVNQDKLERILFIGINKYDFLNQYIKNDHFEYLDIFDPSSSKIEKIINVATNKGIPSKNKIFDSYHAKKENHPDATFHAKDLRWIDYNEDTVYNLKSISKDSIKKHYDLLFLALNGGELKFLSELSDISNQFKVVKFTYTQFNIDAKNFLKDYFMFFYSNDFISFQLIGKKLIRIQKYNNSLEHDYKKTYYFINKKFLTKVNSDNVIQYMLENYVDNKNT